MMEGNYNAATYFREFFQNMMDFNKAFDYTKAMENFEQILGINKNNASLASEINKMLSAKVQVIMEKQSEIFHSNSKMLMEAMKDLSQNMADPKRFVERQKEFSQQAMKNNMQYAQELADLYTQGMTEMFSKYFEQMQNTGKAVQEMQKSVRAR